MPISPSISSPTREQRMALLERQRARLERQLDALAERDEALTRWRLLSFLAVFVVGGVVLVTLGALVWAVVSVLLLVPFVMTVRWHRQVETSAERFGRLHHHIETQLAHMRLDWDALPAARALPERFTHPFALDLDLLGERSLHRLLDTAESDEGSQRLADWLLATEPNATISAERQAIVAELIDMGHFRNRLLLNGQAVGDSAELGARWSATKLLTWLDQESDAAVLRRSVLLLTALALVNGVLLAGSWLLDWPPLWFGSWVLYGVVTIFQLPRTALSFQDAAFLDASLQRLHKVFGFLERFSYRGRPHLAAKCAPLASAETPPSTHLRRVGRLIGMAGIRYNPMVAILLNMLVPWDVFTAYRLALQKGELARVLPTWLAVWFDLEALSSLANFGALNPGSVLPELVESDVTVAFSAEGLGHPLIVAEDRVVNDYSVPHVGAVSIITGSNMAGKSSFLRTLGLAVCLAQAGGPVLARSLTLRPLRLFASIRVADSVTDGFSFFYAEVRRLKWLLDELGRDGEAPLFFLIDEIFRGTNNRERLLGSRAYVRALVGQNGLGAIATHDLELVRLEDESSAVVNYHFRDDVADGQMVFDYRLHAGPCPTTNALKIMALAGLPVEQEA